MRVSSFVRTASALILFGVAFHICAADEQGMPTSSDAGPHKRTPLRLDSANPLRIGDKYYPSESKRRHEEGRCLMNVTIQADGNTRDVSIKQSTRFPLLDKACLDALFPGKFIPATEDGKPIEVTVVIPIIWSLK